MNSIILVLFKYILKKVLRFEVNRKKASGIIRTARIMNRVPGIIVMILALVMTIYEYPAFLAAKAQGRDILHLIGVFSKPIIAFCVGFVFLIYAIKWSKIELYDVELEKSERLCRLSSVIRPGQTISIYLDHTASVHRISDGSIRVSSTHVEYDPPLKIAKKTVILEKHFENHSAKARIMESNSVVLMDVYDDMDALLQEIVNTSDRKKKTTGQGTEVSRDGKLVVRKTKK